MDWDSLLFCDEPKSEELIGRVNPSCEEKADKEKKKPKETYKKIASLIHQLAIQDSFSVENFSCDNNEQTILEIVKANNAVSIIIASQTISRNRRDLWRKEREMMIREKKLKRINDLKEVISKIHHRSFWEGISVCSVR